MKKKKWIVYNNMAWRKVLKEPKRASVNQPKSRIRKIWCCVSDEIGRALYTTISFCITKRWIRTSSLPNWVNRRKASGISRSRKSMSSIRSTPDLTSLCKAYRNRYSLVGMSYHIRLFNWPPTFGLPIISIHSKFS